MCGVVGYVGTGPAGELLLNGLRRLEYRGYDSAGLAVLDGDRLEIRREVGRVRQLVERVRESPVPGHVGVAHTRWATHGGRGLDVDKPRNLAKSMTVE